MKPYKLDLQPCTQPPRGEARVQLIHRKIESEKVLRTTLELTLAQLLREQRDLLSASAPRLRSSSLDLAATSSTPSPPHLQPTRPRASSAAELPTENMLTMSPNTRRRRDKDEVKLTKKRRRISNKLVNLDYMLKKRSLEQRAASANLERSQKRPRPSEVIVEAYTNSEQPRESTIGSDQCPSVGSTSPQEYHDSGLAPSDWGCSPPSSSPPEATAAAPTTWLSFAESSSSIWADPGHLPVSQHMPSEPLDCETDRCLQDVIHALAYEGQSSPSAVTTPEDHADDCLAFLESVLLGSGKGGLDEAMMGHDAILSDDDEFDLSRFLDSPSLDLLTV